MKTLTTFILVFALGAIMISCEKNEDFTQVSTYEKALHDEVVAYRASQGLGNLVLQFVMVKEAQNHSVDLANGTRTDPLVGLENRYTTILDKLVLVQNQPYANHATIFSTVTNLSAKEVVESWAEDSAIAVIMKGDFTQSGPGIGNTSDGRTYITHMFLKIPSK